MREDVACAYQERTTTGYKVDGQSVILFEVRPQWNDPSKYLELPYAKLTFVRSRNLWKLYWRRADLKFHNYQPKSSARDLSALVEEIEKDPYGCFHG